MSKLKNYENKRQFIFASDAKDFYKSLKVKDKKIRHEFGVCFPMHFVVWNN